MYYRQNALAEGNSDDDSHGDGDWISLEIASTIQSGMAHFSVRFKAFDYYAMLRAQKQIQSALSLCRPISPQELGGNRNSDSQSGSHSADQQSLAPASFGLLDENPKVLLPS